MQQLSSPASVFCVAAPSDAALLAKWERHLKPLVQAKHITLWSDQHLMAGTPRMQQIRDHLDHADLVVLLLSSDFFADDEGVALMERAIKRAERDEARLIPLLLRPVAWRESPLAPFPCMPSDNHPVTEWSSHDAAFEACVRDIRRLLGRPITAPLTHHHTHTKPPQNQNRTRMLRRVRKIWIDGLLMQSLHDVARIELHLQGRPDVLETPLRLQVQELDQAPKTLPDGTTIVQVYDRAEGELLILGESGSGKTTLLLELAATLLERAEKDEQLRMPVIFNLSSWAEKREPLHAWLVEELWKIYQVPRKIGKAWIDADHILPLLDGLDEVAKDARGACVQQIKAYYQARLESGSSPIVVCCRSEEYTALSTRVVLGHAVSILPLTDAQITTYLEQAGEQVKGLRQALDEDAELHSLARQPLMLNIFTLAYRGARTSEIPTGTTQDEMQHIIFARYVERMLGRRRQLKRWKPEQTIHWLTFLAKQIRQHDQTVFSVENLQPTWLPKGWRILYHWCVRLPVGLLLGALSGLLVSLFFGLSQGLLSGLFVGLFFGLPQGLLRGAPRLGLLLGLFAWLFVGLLHGLILGLLAGLLVGLLAGLLVWLLGGINRGLLNETDGDRIDPREALAWSWKQALSGLLRGGLLHGLIFGLIAWLIVWLLHGLILGVFSATNRVSPYE